MKASGGRGTSERAQTASDGGLALEDAENSSTRALQCKELLLSSSDTDDGDAPYSKLVIDLDASGGGTELPPAEAKQEQPAAMSALSGATGAKSRAAVDGAAKPAPSSHRASKPPHSAELANGAQKGLKMKIRCSQSGGGGQPPRHEVSHFHPVVGSPPPPPPPPGAPSVHATASAASAPGHGSKAGGQEKARGSGSHRRDRQLAKDRAKEKHPTPGDHGLTGSGAVVVVSRDISLDGTKTINMDGVDRDTASVAVPPVPHDPYEFNASSEDSISCPTKKMKFEQV